MDVPCGLMVNLESRKSKVRVLDLWAMQMLRFYSSKLKCVIVVWHGWERVDEDDWADRIGHSRTRALTWKWIIVWKWYFSSECSEGSNWFLLYSYYWSSNFRPCSKEQMKIADHYFNIRYASYYCDNWGDHTIYNQN